MLENYIQYIQLNGCATLRAEKNWTLDGNVEIEICSDFGYTDSGQYGKIIRYNALLKWIYGSDISPYIPIIANGQGTTVLEALADLEEQLKNQLSLEDNFSKDCN